MEVRPQFMRSNTVTSFGRVISVRGSLARVGLLAPGQVLVSEARATVGRFISIRCAAATTIIAMITEVSCESPSTSDEYIATASVDLPRNILLTEPIATGTYAADLPNRAQLPSGRYMVRLVLDIGLDHYIGIQRELNLVRENPAARGR